MVTYLRQVISKVACAAAVALVALAISAAPASANAICNPTMESFPALIPDIVIGTGGTLTFTQTQVLTDWQNAQQYYCGNENLAQMLESMDPSYSSWSSDDQAAFNMMLSGVDPRQGFASVSTMLFQNGSTYLSYLQQHDADLANATSQMQAQQATGEIESDIADAVTTQAQTAAAQQTNDALGRAQGYSDTGQMFDLNSDPSSGWDW